MTETQAAALARLRRLFSQPDHEHVDDVYGDESETPYDDPIVPVQWMEDLQTVAEMTVEQTHVVYGVGWDDGNYVFDRVFGPSHLTDAVSVCEDRAATLYDGVVVEIPLGDHLPSSWKVVHRKVRKYEGIRTTSR